MNCFDKDLNKSFIYKQFNMAKSRLLEDILPKKVLKSIRMHGSGISDEVEHYRYLKENGLYSGSGPDKFNRDIKEAKDRQVKTFFNGLKNSGLISDKEYQKVIKNINK
jgi:hypothetical protein